LINFGGEGTQKSLAQKLFARDGDGNSKKNKWIPFTDISLRKG